MCHEAGEDDPHVRFKLPDEASHMVTHSDPEMSSRLRLLALPVASKVM